MADNHDTGYFIKYLLLSFFYLKDILNHIFTVISSGCLDMSKLRSLACVLTSSGILFFLISASLLQWMT